MRQSWRQKGFRNIISHQDWLYIKPRVLAVLMFGLLASGFAAIMLDDHNRLRTRKAVTAATDSTITQIRNRMDLYQYGLRGVRGLLIGQQYGLSRDEFRRYSLTRDIDTEFPGARGFGVILRVPRDREDDFLQQARADGKPDFTIRELAPHNGERFVIKYVEPIERNAAAVGLDIASESNRREAALAAVRTGKAQITGPITLVQASGNPLQSFLLVLPCYDGGTTPDTEAARRAQAIGWSYAPLLMREVFLGLQLDNDLTHLALRDVTHPADVDAAPFYLSDDDGLALSFTETRTFDVYGRRWQAQFSVHPAFIDNLHLVSPSLVGAIGCLFSALLSVLAGALGAIKQRR
jgi:CHASE1-domain containing sensor protein